MTTLTLTKLEFEQMSNMIHDVCGIVVTPEKEYLIIQRLSPLAVEAGCSNFSEYCNKLKSASCMPDLKEKLIAAITTNETLFFRDQHPFETLSLEILPELVSKLLVKKGRGDIASQIRIWSAAASTGQEPYSIAMCINELVESQKFKNITINDFKIVATDISEEVLSRARHGSYNQCEIARGLSDYHKNKYFKQHGDKWIIDCKIKNMVEFRHFNLTHQFSAFVNYDIVFCRNVLIYFDDKTKMKILSGFYEILSSSGILILGAMENTYCLNDNFKHKRSGKTIYYQK